MTLSLIAPLAAATPDFAALDRRGQAGEPLSVVFFGGSLTWGANASDPQRTSYRALMADYLRSRYPRAPLTFHDAAIGGTGSQLGVFRLERDVLAHRPDLVFLDFTVNDGLDGDSRPPLVSYETLLRELIGGGVPVVQVVLGFRYNFGPDYRPDTVLRRRDHLRLAAAYGTGVGDAFPWVQQQLTSGVARVEQVWPMDGGHPDDIGYRFFFEAVRQGFEQAVTEKRFCRVPSQPVFGVYTNCTRWRLVDHALPVGWTRALTYRTSLWFDGLSSRWMDDVAVCAVADRDRVQPLRIPFTGTFVGVFGEADQDGLGFRVLVDGAPVPESVGSETNAPWEFTTKRFGTGRLFVWRVIADTLPAGEHMLELVPDIPVGLEKGQLRIESLCFAGE